MFIPKRPVSYIVFVPKVNSTNLAARQRFYHLLPSRQFSNHHVAPPRSPPIARSLSSYTVNKHGTLLTLYTRVPSNHYTHSRSHPRSHPPSSASLHILLARRAPLRTLPLHHLHTPHPPPASRMLISTERLSSAWRHTPMKWNPLPWFVGALLLVLIQYRRHRAGKEVYVDEDGHEVIRLKGPWQVSTSFYISFSTRSFLGDRAIDNVQLLEYHTLCSATPIMALVAVRRVSLHEWCLYTESLSPSFVLTR
jgi:hypothetical protein